MRRIHTLPRRLGLLIATALAALVFAIDVFSGSEIRVYPLYFAGVILAGVIASRAQAAGFALLCAGLWLASKYLDGTVYSAPSIWAWNTAAQAASFLLVAMLVQKLNALLDASLRFSAQLASRNAALDSKSIELEASNAALNVAMQALSDADRIARHDLKTPLNNILATAGLLLSRTGLAEDDSRLLSGVKSSARRALAMVNLSLTLHQIEEKRYRFNPMRVDLKATATAAIEDLQSHAEAKNVSLHLATDGDVPMVLAQPEMSYSLVANVLKNAIEAAPEGSEVGLRLTRDDGWVTLDVVNRGTVPVEIRERFFAKYATHGKPGGSGLGAYSARLMAEAMGGRLTMTTAENADTTLTLRLRGATPESSDSSPTTPATAQAAAPALAGSTIGGISVLIVDDDDYNRLVLTRMLPDSCAWVATAINGRAALDRVREKRPDVVFLDINMPVMGGIEALEEIRACQAELGQAPSFIVAFSAIDDPHSSARYLALGFDACLNKPSTRQQVADLLGARASPVGIEQQVDANNIVRIDGELAPLIDGFRTSRSAMLGELIFFLDAKDSANASRLAHQLGGSLGVFGFNWASGECKAIEAELGGDDWPGLAARARAVLEHLKQAQALPANGPRK